MSLHISVKYCCRFIFWCTGSVSLTKRTSTQDLKEFKVPLQTCSETNKDTLHYILYNMVEFQSFKNSGKTSLIEKFFVHRVPPWLPSCALHRKHACVVSDSLLQQMEEEQLLYVAHEQSADKQYQSHAITSGNFLPLPPLLSILSPAYIFCSNPEASFAWAVLLLSSLFFWINFTIKMQLSV